MKTRKFFEVGYRTASDIKNAETMKQFLYDNNIVFSCSGCYSNLLFDLMVDSKDEELINNKIDEVYSPIYEVK